MDEGTFDGGNTEEHGAACVDAGQCLMETGPSPTEGLLAPVEQCQGRAQQGLLEGNELLRGHGSGSGSRAHCDDLPGPAQPGERKSQLPPDLPQGDD